MLRITPRGKQEEVMALPARGHLIVLGTAGSGKTTIALLRAAHLSNLPGNGKVLLVTFNRALVQYMRGIIHSPSSKLVVEHYHKFARGYMDSDNVNKMPQRNGILGPGKKAHYIEQAVEELKKLYPKESTLRRTKEFFIDEITFIQRFGFANLDAYCEAERIGRASVRLTRENRKWIFIAYQKYIELREAAGRKYDWDDLAFYVNNELQSDTNERRYTHIIVDEGQDFSPMMIKSLVNAVRKGGSFTFFGDVAQQIYGSRLSWRDSGVNADKVWRFDINYRNPATITAFANDIIQSDYWQQDDDMVTAINQIAEGPKPILVSFENKSREIKWLVERAISTGKTSSTVIVCRSRAEIDSFIKALSSRGCNATEIDKDTPGYAHVKTVYLTTFHAAKGMEFDNVFVPFLSDDKFPDPDTVANAVSEDAAYADEIKLLYVAATRSKYGLYMTYSGTLTPLFPVESDSYDSYGEENEI
ncbi:MAG: AAA family ATPase [Defluviitaleaceae bacterium]|nr:AAA family ATPase [Defluviitaleaceae bacterium]